MKIFALVKNELRTAMPWVLSVIVIMVLIGSFLIYVEIDNWRGYRTSWRQEPGAEIGSWEFRTYSPLSSFGPLLLCVSCVLGIVLGGVQFWLPFFSRTWGFTLHRSVSRLAVISAKLISATIAFLVSLGLIWTFLFYYLRAYHVFPLPPTGRVFAEGWLMIFLGLLTYLAVGLCAISTARWYTTKMFALGFVFIAIVSTFAISGLYAPFVLAVIAGAIIKWQLVYEFLTREF